MRKSVAVPRVSALPWPLVHPKLTPTTLPNPESRRRWIVGLGLAALGAFAAAGLAQGVYYALQYSQDFQWSPAVLLSEGRDAYDWYLSGNPGERIILSQEPNYLHLLYVLFLPFAALPWPVAKAAWALCNVGMSVACATLLTREAGLRGAVAAAAALTFLAASPVAHAIGNGQQSLLALLALALAWRSRQRAAGGVAAAIAASKYSFAPPVLLWLLLERRAAALSAAALTGLAGLIAYAWLCGQTPLAVAIEPLEVSTRATRIGLADAMSLARALELGPAWVYSAGLAVCGLGVALLWRRRRELDEFTIFALLCQLSLFSLFHHLYDYVLLAPLFCRALTFPSALRALTLAYVGFFWFVLHNFDAAPAMKSPAAIAAMAMLSAGVFLAIAGAFQRRFALPIAATSVAAL